MGNDDEIPSSQPVPTQQKKRKKSKLALKASNSAKLSTIHSGKANNSENPKKPLTEVNLYVGLLDETIGRNVVTLNKCLDTGNDMFDDVRQLELGNLINTLPSKKETMPIVFESPEGLKTVKSFIETHEFDPNTSHICDNKPQNESIRSTRSFARHEAQQLLDENLQFSEWPIEQPKVSIIEKSPDIRRTRSKLSFAMKEAQQIMNESFQFSEWPIEQQNAPVKEVTAQERGSQHLQLEQSCASSIVDSILNDFGDDFVQSEESLLKSPPMILSRKRNPRIYKRTLVAKDRQLMWDSEPCDKESILKSQVNISIDDNIDVDLDSSYRIIENITNLSTFFTRTQTFELDFERCLSQNSGQVEYVEDNVIIDLDDENVSPNRNNTQIHRVDFNATSHFWSDDDDDFLHKVNSPSPDMLNKLTAGKRNCGHISTPNSFAKSNKRFKANFATPSTSKAFMENEQRDFLPKRLHFEAECDNQTIQMNDMPTMSLKPLKAKPMNKGFSTAAGKTFTTSTNAMKKQLRVFARIEAECQQVVRSHGDTLPINKNDDKSQCDNQLSSRPICDSNQKMMPTDGFYKNLTTSVGFLTGRGNSAAISDNRLKNSRQLFKNVFEEFGELDTATNIDKNVIPNVFAPQMDFKSAAGSSVAIKPKTLQKYQEMDVDIFDDCEAGPSTKAPIERPIVCKTPLSKCHQNSNRVATSTPNLNGKNYFNSPCITPINKAKRMAPIEKEQESIKSLNDTGAEEYRNIFSDTHPEPIHRIPTEAILDVSEINILDVSISQTDILCIPEDIKLAREETFSKQQVNVMKKPHKIIPKMGSLCLDKLLICRTQIVPIKTIKKFQTDELRQFGLPDNVIEVTIENATKFKFDMWNYYSNEECRSNADGIELPDDIKLIMDRNARAGIREISSAFLMCPVVDPKLVPDNWIRNCFKWIVVKLAAMDRAFAYRKDGRYLTPENVMLQLKYRYDREIDRAQRPAIRRIVEMDDLAAKRMVLFVSAIHNENDTPRALQLCDGWYAMRTTSLDPALVKAVQNKKIKIGTKLIIQGAELHGCTEGAHPLEMSSAAALKISANSTRRAKWNLKLGFCRESWPFAISLNSVSEQGGLISRMNAFVLRVYPLVYIVKETVSDSTKSTMRSSKVEKRFRRKEDNKRFEMVEKFYNEANNEIEEEDKAARQTMDLPSQQLKEIDNGEDLWKLLEVSHDAESFELNLSMSQKQLLQNHQTIMNDKKSARIHKLASEKLKDWSTDAKTTPMLKVRLIDAKNPTISKMSILNLWNATEDLIDIRENTFIEIQKAMAKGMCGRDIQITAYGTSAIRQLLDYHPTEQHANLRRKLTNLCEIDARTFKPLFNEFDTIGYVLEMTEANPGQFQSIFFIDAHKNFLCIKFWHSVKEYGYEDIVQKGRFLCMNHLDWRPQHTTNRNKFPQAFANEYTVFTENPKDKEKSTALETFRQDFQTLNLDEYISECRSELDKDVPNILNVSNMATTPLRPNNSNLNNVTRTTIDCLPSPSQSVEKRISRLRSYGDLAAPTKPIYLGTRRGLGTTFRTPVRKSASDAGISTSRNKNQEN